MNTASVNVSGGVIRGRTSAIVHALLGAPSRESRPGASCGLAFAVSFGAFLCGSHAFLTGDLLVFDDTIYVGKAIVGRPDIVWSAPVPHLLLYGLSAFESVPLLKFAWLALHSAVAGVAAALFSRSVTGVVLPALMGVALAALPVAADQVVFITGSHPTVALLFLLASLLAFDCVDLRKRRTGAVNCAGVAVLLFLAALSSPTAFLAPVALPLWLMISWIRMRHERIDRTAIPLVVAIGSVVVGYAMLGVGSYHYSGLVGWTEFSPERVLKNFLSSATRCASSIVAPNPLMLTLHVLVSLLLIVVAFMRVRTRSTRDDGVVPSGGIVRKGPAALGWNSLILSMLTFGPSSITTSVLDRYLIPPVCLVGIAIGFCLLVSLRLTAIAYRAGFGIGVGILACAYLTQGWHNREQMFRPYHLTHLEVKRAIRNDVDMWPGNAQIVMVTNDGYLSASTGYNHWSTWYLRTLARLPGVIGLVGSEKEITRSPFIDKYRDHGSEYWSVVDGKSRRTKMMGLEMARPLVVYRQNADGRFVRVDRVLFRARESIRSVDWGATPAASLSMDATSKATFDEARGVEFVWPDSGLSGSAGKGRLESRTLSGSESFDLDLACPVGKSVRISFRLRSAGTIISTVYTEATPPMPLLSDAIAIYQHPRGFLVFDRATRQIWPVDAKAGGAKFELVGIEGNVISVRCNDQVVGVLSRPRISGRWTFGRGFHQRYWQGTVVDLLVGEP